MPGLGTVGMSNIGNNMVGLGSLRSVMGIGSARGVGGSGISAPMGPISSIGNMNQNPMNLSSAANISNAIRSGTLTPAQAAYMKLRIQNRSNVLGNPPSSIGNMPGARQMHPGSAGLSMLGPALNRANINQMQRTAMGPPKLMSGMNPYMTRSSNSSSSTSFNSSSSTTNNSSCTCSSSSRCSCSSNNSSYSSSKKPLHHYKLFFRLNKWVHHQALVFPIR
ncbi:UNVERIFIED_CONTAM: protein PHYTOCHROME-DEPENDENT LATE-FLOWERING [Sesamum latifolium]|uniref:Protein PHYTOCHROME-DEPENDENT LATE-FLOWERING n=1 Tax=Sesamum latifolium TaxID=2727402 RepID=A0AAW2UGJ0_9LAMI